MIRLLRRFSDLLSYRLGRITDAGFALAAFLVLAPSLITAAPLTLDWQRQVGTLQDDVVNDLAIDAVGNSYITGDTTGTLNGQTNAGMRDAFQLSFASDGTDRWTRLDGTAADDTGIGAAATPAGENYQTGWTNGGLGGGPFGMNDIHMLRFLSGGGATAGLAWGTSSFDSGQGIGVDASANFYIAGQTGGNLNGQTGDGSSQAFVLKANSSGTHQWTRLLGSAAFASDLAADIAVDPTTGTSTLAGFTGGNLASANAGGNDAFAARYDTSGNQLWTAQLGSTGSDTAWSVAIDPSGNSYITGEAGGSMGGQTFNGGFADAFVAKYDPAGTLEWVRLLGDTGTDVARKIAVDNLGNSYIVGYTDGTLGAASVGFVDTFIAKYDPSGSLKWVHQIGTSGREEGYGIAVDGPHIYIAGRAYGPFAGTYNGGIDIFAMRFTQIPEPTTLLLLTFGMTVLVCTRRRS
jgi:hypothetical protein